MSRNRVLQYGIFLLTMIFGLPITAQAQSPWQWQTSLRLEAPDNLVMPSGIAVDETRERYYVVDTGRNRLVSFDRAGTLLQAFTADERLKTPFDMVRLENGQLLVVEKGRNSITRIDLTAREVTPQTVRDNGRLVYPERLALSGGKLYVLDRASGQVLRLKEDLTVEQRLACGDCQGGISDFTAAEGAIWALDGRGKTVYRFRGDGSLAETISLGNEARFPVSLALDPGGFLYILDRNQGDIIAYGPDRKFRYRFLGLGHTKGQLFFPLQIRFDPWGRLCVVDEGNGRVEVFGR